METIGIVLNIGQDQTDDFERGFRAWNRRADAYQTAEPYVFGGETIVSGGP